MASKLATVSLIFGVHLHSSASEPLEGVPADLNFPRSGSANASQLEEQKAPLDEPLIAGETYSLTPTVQTSGNIFDLSTVGAPTIHTFDGASSSGGGNYFGSAGGWISVTETQFSLGGGVNRYQVDVTTMNSGGTLEPWVAGSWAGNGLVYWRLDVGSTFGGLDVIQLAYPVTNVSSGVTAFNSAGNAIGTYSLFSNTSTSTSLSGVAKLGLGGLDIAGYDLATLRMFWDVTTPADLAVFLVDATDGAYDAGDAFEVLVGIENLGATASGTSAFSVYASTDTNITTADHLLGSFIVPVIGPADFIGAVATTTIPWNLANGKYYIGVILDYSDPNNTNNVNYDPDLIKVPNSGDILVRPLALEFVEQAVNLTSETNDQIASVSPSGMMQAALPGLMTKAESEGSVRVVVGFDAGTQLDGLLSEANRQTQRQAIQSRGGELLRALAGLSFKENARFRFIPYMSLTVSANALQRLASLPFVTSIEVDEHSSPTMASSNTVIGSPLAWAEGYDGAGQTIAILDSGVDKAHPWFTTGGSKVVSEACYSSTTTFNTVSVCPSGLANSTAPDSGVNCSGDIAGCGHGTSVAGIAVGNNGAGPDFGVARGADIIAIQVFSRFNNQADCGSVPAPCARSYNSDQISALERVYALRNVYDIASVNMSLGGGQYFDQATCDAANVSRKAAIDNLRSVGIATVIAAGNDEYKNSIGAPGCISSAISVSSTTDADDISSFSNIYPQIHLLAPGTSIWSASAGGGTRRSQGTSASAPHVAGAWAVLKQINPGATVSQILSLLQNTGTLVDDLRSGGIETDIPRINLDLAIGEPRTTFGIFNEGPATLNVSSISPQTSAPWVSWSPQAPFTVQPGELKVVSVVIDYASAPAGPSQVRLLINSNDPEASPYPDGVYVNVTPLGIPAGITVSAISGNTTEAGGTATFTVVLNSQPTANVTIGLSSTDTTEGTVSPSSLVFTNANWNSTQLVTVTGVDDNLVDGNVGYSIITAAATSSDVNYSGLNAADVSVTNTDDESDVMFSDGFESP